MSIVLCVPFCIRMGDERVVEVMAHCFVCSDPIGIHTAMVPKGSVLYMPMLFSVKLTSSSYVYSNMIGLADQLFSSSASSKRR